MRPPKRKPAPGRERSPERRRASKRGRREWPRAYDGGPPSTPRRSRRAERSALGHIRRNPVRSGLIGLTIVGASLPLAAERYQEVVRNDPSHERFVNGARGAGSLDDLAVAEAWRAAEARGAAPIARERAIRENLQQFREYGVTEELARDIYDTALEAKIDPEIAFGLVRTESSFQNSATSHVGAIGLTQLMPRTAEWLEPGVTEGDLRDTRTNLRIGFQYLRDLIDRYQGDTHLALLAYNRGPGTVDRVLDEGGDPDNGYPNEVLHGE